RGITLFNAVAGVCAFTDAVVTTSGNTKFCEGGSVQLSAMPGFAYSWSNGSTTRTVTSTTSGTYNVTVTNWAGVSAVSAPVTVTVYKNPVANITSGGPLSICAPNTVTLTTGAYTGFAWSNGQTMQSITVSQAGSYV